MSESTTYLTVEQAAEHVGAPSANALRKWVHRHGVPHFYYGRHLRFLRRDLDEAVGNTRRGNRSLQSLPSRRVKRDRSLKGSDVSPQDVGCHASQSDSFSHLNPVTMRDLSSEVS